MPLPTPESFQLASEYDVVIVGSGGASMCAALAAKQAGLTSVILEKRDVIGGSTGFSGGLWWVPDNHVIKRNGIPDTRERARAYLNATVTFDGAGTTPVRREAFLHGGPEMIEFLEQQGMQFYHADGWSDYYDDRPGGEPRGRSLMAKPFDTAALEGWAGKLSLYGPGRDLPLGSDELMPLFLFRRTWKGRRKLAKLVSKMIINKITKRQVVGSGGSIQGRMMEMTLKRNIPIFTGCATTDYILEDGRVVGVKGQRDGKPFSVRATRGVLLNSGGFSRNDAMRQKYQRHPIKGSWTNANPGDTGEMLEATIAIGAATENLDLAWWVITSLNTDLSFPKGAVAKDGTAYPFMHNADVACPHLMIVDGEGKRYMNEATSYVEMGELMYQQHEINGKGIPSWAIFDSRHLSRYCWGSVMPGAKPIKDWIESGFMKKADSISELAGKCGIDPAALQATTERFNGFARSGKDLDFHKGDNAYNRYRGDPTHGSNPCLGEISKGPFYGIALYPADVGTAGGIVTDENARVLRPDGSVIPGLYAAGNCTSSVMGRSYPGAGASIAASFTFGYLAAKHLAAQNNGPQAF
jgi:3-oxosteroid 1-dehydrogenase